MTQLKVLVACEFSGTVRDQFVERGHDAWSCDLLPDERGSNRHIQCDVREILNDGWDLLMVAHPPCTRLCNSGVRWLSDPPTKLTAEHYTKAEVEAYTHMTREQRLAFMWHKLDEGAALFSDLWNAPIPRKAIENPVMHNHAKRRIRNYRTFTQSVQPYQFGHKETKRTCLWLDNLPPLQHTTPELEQLYRSLPATERRKWARVHNASAGAGRWAERSRFFKGIAVAMATQWSSPTQFELAV